MEKLTCGKAKEIDLVNYLAFLGHYPARRTSSDYWYLSPLREEKTASFKVNWKLNLWYDHGASVGGDIIDFGVLYFRCGISTLLKTIAKQLPNLSSQPLIYSPRTTLSAGENKDTDAGKITVLDTRPLQDKNLIAYLEERCIPLNIADRFCREVDFDLYGKKYTVIGFENQSGGYELRSRDFKGSSSPKDSTFIDNRGQEVSVFEGFTDFLSLYTINQGKQILPTNYLVLNSLVFLEKSRSLMEQHQRVNLHLDRDPAGFSHTRKALEWSAEKYIDNSSLYQGHKDLNDHLIQVISKQRLMQPKQDDFRIKQKKGWGQKW